MLAANEAVALELETRRCPALYRVHDAPEPGPAGRSCARLLRPLGHRAQGRADEPPSRGAAAGAARRSQGQPGGAVRLLGGPAHDAAGGLQPGVPGPLRPGLALLLPLHLADPALSGPGRAPRPEGAAPRQRPAASADTALAARLPAMGEHTQHDRAAGRAVRARPAAMEEGPLPGRPGGRDASRAGSRASSPSASSSSSTSYFVDGLVPIRTMGDDYYVYEAESHRLVGERTTAGLPARRRRRGRADRRSLRHRGLDLKIVGMPEPGERGEWPKQRERERGERKETKGRRSVGAGEKKERKRRR